nr:immunoglobulin heavy chain junction region [Macaca mulatta]
CAELSSWAGGGYW